MAFANRNCLLKGSPALPDLHHSGLVPQVFPGHCPAFFFSGAGPVSMARVRMNGCAWTVVDFGFFFLVPDPVVSVGDFAS